MSVRLLTGDCRDVLPTLPDASVQCVVTSPPYWGLRDYGHAEQLGLESTPDAYVAAMVGVFREVRRVLRDDGTLWLNLGDSYASDVKGTGGPSSSSGLKRDGRPESSRLDTIAREKSQTAQRGTPRFLAHGLKAKDLVGVPWRVAFALQADGWWLRSDIIWSKPNPMPESVTDRPTKAHEYLFLLTKAERYYYDADAIREPWSDDRLGAAGGQAQHYYSGRPDGHTRRPIAAPSASGRNRRSVWTITTEPCPDAHFAVMPTKLVEPCVLAGSRIGDTVLDPFGGSGTVGRVAEALGRHSVLIELNPAYVAIAERRTAQRGLFAQERQSA